MSSSQSQNSTSSVSKSLIPVGLPATYIGSWAVVGLVALTYLGFAAAQPEGFPAGGLAPLEVAENTASPKAEPTKPKQTETPKREFDETTIATNSSPVPKSPSVEKAEPIQRSIPVQMVKPKISDTPSEVRPVLARPHIAAPFSTQYVTTQQILSSQLPVEVSAPAPEPQQIAQAAKPPPATSSIVTGSISVPPPPARGPPRPAVVRSTLKPAAPARITSKAQAKKTNIAFGPPVVRPSVETPALAILLATGSSVESLRATWTVLRKRHATALYNLNARYIIEPNQNASERKFALLAGPVISATDVARVCSVLVSEGLNCRTRPFTGNSM